MAAAIRAGLFICLFALLHCQAWSQDRPMCARLGEAECAAREECAYVAATERRKGYCRLKSRLGSPRTQANEASAAPTFPAEGCPDKFPSYRSVSNFCKDLPEDRCKGENTCSFSSAWKSKEGKEYPARCHAKIGTYIPPPDPDPEAMARMGLATLDLDLAVSEGPAHKLAEKGDELAGRKQFDRAIDQYARALKADPLHGAALVGRAIAYEHKANKPKALADYCNALIATASRAERALARERIALLTQPAAEPTPLPIPMASGVIRRKGGRAAPAPLKISSPSGADYVVKIVNVHDGAEEMLIYLRAGSTYQVQVPYGTYKLRGAFGPTWYGEKHLFGKNTAYFKLELKAGSDEFKFFRDGNVAKGHYIQLIKQVGGNLETTTISAKDF
jgi:tetratricopeptide (TPR) repeat protein